MENTNETNSELKITAKDLSLFVGLPCLIFDGGKPVSHYIEGVDIDQNKVIAERTNYNPEQIKPILRRLEDITVEETVHISCNILEYDMANESIHKTWNENDKKEINEFGMIQFNKQDSIFMPLIIAYLIKQGFNLHLIPHGTYFEKDSQGRLLTEEYKIELNLK